MSDFSAKFFVKPEVDPQAANKAEAQLDQLAKQGAAAMKAGNEKLLRDLNIQAHQIMKKGGNPTLDVDVNMEYSSVTGALGEVKRMSASALDPLIKDYQKMVDIQGEAALEVKKEIQLQQQNLSKLKQKQQHLSKHSKQYKKNAAAQKLVVDQTKKLEKALMKVTTLASMKGQLRAESQKLSMMNQYNLGLNKQGQLVTTLNGNWVKQKALVQGLGAQVTAAGFAAQGFGAKVAAAGAAMQAAFGWIAAVVAGLTAIAGSIGAITGRVKDIQAIKLTFDGLGQSVEAQNAILGSAKNIALSYGVSLRKVEGAFRRLGPAILESGGSLKDTEGAIKSIAARTTMLGLNTEQTGRYIEAFAQVMGKGKLQSEELNQQFSELDGGLRGQLKNWLAANKGITDFETAMKNGEITAGVFLEAFEAINEEIRLKFLRSIGDTQKAITDMGEKGGMTLNQLNAKLQTLTSIGLESVAEALAPLGKELMKVYAAFVQVFTKVATEMPGLQAVFKAVGHVIGVVVKVALNTVIVAFGALLKVIDLVAQGVMWLYEAFKNLPGPVKKLMGPVGAFIDALEWLEGNGPGLNNFFDGITDGFSRLSDETIGATADLEKFNDEMQMLNDMKESGEISQDEFYQKKAKLEADFLEKKKKRLNDEVTAEEEALNKMLQARKDKISRQEQLADREKDDIEAARDAEIARYDAAIVAIKEKAEVTKKAYDDEIAAVKAAAQEQKRAIEDAQAALKANQVIMKREFEDRKLAAKEYYDGLKKEMEAAHTKEMGLLDARIAKMKESQQGQLEELDNGPAKQRLEKAKMLELEKAIAAERDQMKRMEMQAELESMKNAKKKAELEKKFAKELAAEQQKKVELEKKQAEEKKKLDEEEKARMKEIADQQRQTMREIADALASLAQAKRDVARQEKDDIAAIKEKQKAADEAAKRGVKELEKRKDAANKKADAQIDAIDEKLKTQKEKVEDIEAAVTQQATAHSGVADSVDGVTDGALERQLQKVLRIKRELATLKSSGGQDMKFAGGPVSGGTKYTVNELGREGFLSASGKISEIKAPSFGTWKAPSSGTVIPAHIWKSVKANQGAASIRMPSNMDPGNGVARAISTVTNTTAGNNFNQSVTINAANPVQAASDMMVEMARLKRRRYN